MIERTVIYLLLAATASIGVACGDNAKSDGPVCESDADCEEPAPSCVDGNCVECTEDADCGPALVCTGELDGGGSQNQPAPYSCVPCLDDSDCPSEQTCDRSSSFPQCVPQ